LGGSYEETPPTLLDELKRDRRWCQGNLQHLRLLFAEGLRAGHRAVFSMGVMAYASALFWAVFMALNCVQSAMESIYTPDYFPPGPSLFPLWPKWHPEWAIALVSTTAALLFLPKFLSLLAVVKRREGKEFGGALRLGAGILIEILISALLAPVRMWFHAKFVLLTLLGQPIKWGPQSRDDNETGWSEAIRAHGCSTIFAGCWLLASFWLSPSSSWWVLPVALPLLFSAPLSVYSSRVGLGRALRKWRLLVIPEETAPPEIVERFSAAMSERRGDGAPRDGFVFAATDLDALAVHVGMLRGKSPRSPDASARNRELREKALHRGPTSLSGAEKALLLRDAESMTALHLGWLPAAASGLPAGLKADGADAKL
ncbi:MAG TPA: glucan biosynthesis glucosyltransferase H, partial [Candidatus Binatia bacterium]